MTVNTQKKRIGAEIYITDDKEIFEKFQSHKTEIEAELNMELEWRTATKDCRILALQNGDVKQGPSSWTPYFDWFCKMALALREIVTKYV